MIKHPWLTRTSIFAALAVSAALAATAHASKVASSPLSCDNVTGHFTEATGQITIGNISGESIGYFCAVDNVSTISINNVSVDTYKQAVDAIRAKTCVTFAGGGGGTCESTDGNGLTGLATLHPPIASSWAAHPTDYRWIVLTIKRATTGSNTVFGFRQD